MRLSPVFLLLALLVSACTSSPPPPPPPPVAPPVARPVAPPPPKPVGRWEDWHRSPGNWVYRRDDRGSLALFGRAGQDADFIIRCDAGRNAIFLSRLGMIPDNGTAQMTLRASNGVKGFTVRNNGDTPSYVAVDVPVTEPQLDILAFSRGKFIVSIPGGPDLVIPAWAEFSRVIEDCRSR